MCSEGVFYGTSEESSKKFDWEGLGLDHKKKREVQGAENPGF